MGHLKYYVANWQEQYLRKLPPMSLRKSFWPIRNVIAYYSLFEDP